MKKIVVFLMCLSMLLFTGCGFIDSIFGGEDTEVTVTVDDFISVSDSISGDMERTNNVL